MRKAHPFFELANPMNNTSEQIYHHNLVTQGAGQAESHLLKHLTVFLLVFNKTD